MICPTCHGTRYITHQRQDNSAGYVAIPCPECQGQGFSYCCEGAEKDLCPTKERKSKR